MIVLNKTHKFSFSDDYRDVTSDLDKFYLNLITMRRPLINAISKAIKDKRIILVYPDKKDMEVDARVLVLSEDKKKVYVNVTDLSKNLYDHIVKGTVNTMKLYSYLIQAYALLEWDRVISKSRRFIDDALNAYGTMMVKAVTQKGVGFFRDDMEERTFKFLIYCYILNKSNTIISDPVEKAATMARIANEDYSVEIFEKYKDKLTKSISLRTFFDEVLCQEFSWMKKLQDSRYLIHYTFRTYSPTGAMMIDDLRYYSALAVDSIQNTKPIIYMRFGGVSSIVSKNSYKIILDEIANKL